MAKQISVTDEGLKQLENELTHLKNVKRKEVAEAIQIARGFGDLSENSEYDEAKNEQAKVEARIAELEEILKHVKVINESEVHTDSVNIGARVRVYIEKFNEEVEYTVVGSTEANPLENKISDQSPIGKALLGSRVDEEVTAETPAGPMKMVVKEISK
nr:transcription elongation factor GreA [Clostridia bacterium]